ncbi:organic cation transporter 1-like [Oratosquilla oratoria]|uniref:organic cation transporter 1-like n=1 Tax=Oratosquilla oratoria TaxID=337810 RepID=UPI003F758247
MATEFEDILKKSGGYGRYQKRILFQIMVPAIFYSSLQANLIVFQTVVPPYWCDVPGRDKTDYTMEQWKNLTLPESKVTPGSLSKCYQYNVTFVNSTLVVNHQKLRCQLRWDHDETSFKETVATKLNLFCDKEGFAQTIYSVNAAGNAVGTFFLPLIADKLAGRKLMFFVAVAISVVFNFMALLVPTYSLHLTSRFFAGLAYESNWEMPFVIVMELNEPEKRALVSFVVFFVWALGMCATTLVAWLLPNWIHASGLVTVFGIFIFMLWRAVPESPRWLLSRGHYGKCADIIAKVAKINGKGKPPRDPLIQQLKKVKLDQQRTFFIPHVYKYPHITLNLIMIVIQACCCYIVYGSVHLNVSILPSKEFLNFFLASLLQFPSILMGWAVTHYLGRRVASHSLYFGCAVFCLIAALNTSNKWLLLSLAAIIKFFANASIYVVVLYITELFPTPVRSSAFGVTTVLALLSQSIVPSIIAAGGKGESLPYWVIFSLTLVALLCSVPLPETIGLPLPQTYEEAEKLGKFRPLTSWINHWNYSRYLTLASNERSDNSDDDMSDQRDDQDIALKHFMY